MKCFIRNSGCFTIFPVFSGYSNGKLGIPDIFPESGDFFADFIVEDLIFPNFSGFSGFSGVYEYEYEYGIFLETTML